MKEDRQVSRSVVCFDIACIRWRAEFAPFEANGFAALCEFVRVHFDNLIDRYCQEGHESLNDFPTWAFERYLGSHRMIGIQNMISKRRWTANAFESAGVVFGLMMYCTSGCNASHELSCVR